jgi:hypothetical protein
LAIRAGGPDRVIGHYVVADSFGGDRVRDRVVPWRRAIRDADTDQQRIHGRSFDLLR